MVPVLCYCFISFSGGRLVAREKESNSIATDFAHLLQLLLAYLVSSTNPVRGKNRLRIY